MKSNLSAILFTLTTSMVATWIYDRLKGLPPVKLSITTIVVLVITVATAAISVGQMSG